MFLARAFIQTFGITQPTPQRERRVAWMLVLMMLLVVGMVAGMGLLLRGWFLHR